MTEQTPHQRFLDCLSEFETAIDQAIGTSESRMGVRHTGRQNRVLVSFAKAVSHAMSVHLLCDACAKHAPNLGFLDHFSIGTLTRTLIDASIMTMYLSEPKLSAAEWDLRRHILFLYDATNRKRFLSWGSKLQFQRQTPEDAEAYQKHKASVLSVINARGTELGLSTEKIEQLSKGNSVFLDGLRGAVREAGLNSDQFEFLYAYLSNHVHSHPASVLRLDKFSFDQPTDFQLSFCGVCLTSATEYLEATKLRVDSFTGDIKRDPNGDMP